MSISYIGREFNPPRILFTEAEYADLKNQLKNNPNFKLAPETNFSIQYKFYLTALGISVILIYLGNFEKKIPVLGYVAFVAVVFALACILSLLFSLHSHASYSAAQNEFYSKLKIDILESSGYYDFIYNKRKLL